MAHLQYSTVKHQTSHQKILYTGASLGTVGIVIDLLPTVVLSGKTLILQFGPTFNEYNS
jgi:hypothetical protein